MSSHYFLKSYTLSLYTTSSSSTQLSSTKLNLEVDVCVSSHHFLEGF